MGYTSRKYQIDVVMKGDPPGPPEPILKESGQVIDPNVPIIFNKDKDQMKKIDHYRIRFEIRKFNKSPLRFVPKQADAMWVNNGTACPTSPCQLPGVFWVDKMDPDGEWIDVINMDMVAEEFRFTLNFVDKSITNPTPANYVPLDPIGGNEDRGRSGSGISSNAFMAVGVGAVAGLVTFCGARLLIPRW